MNPPPNLIIILHTLWVIFLSSPALTFSSSNDNYIKTYKITSILNSNHSFSHYDGFIQVTGLDRVISNTNPVTVLVADNRDANELVNLYCTKPKSIIKDIIAAHVLPNYYYDHNILAGLPNYTTERATTLYKHKGLTASATRDDGYVVDIVKNGNDIFFVTAANSKGQRQRYSQLMGVIMARPFEISVLQINRPIIPPEIFRTPASPPVSQRPFSPPSPVHQQPTDERSAGGMMVPMFGGMTTAMIGLIAGAFMG